MKRIILLLLLFLLNSCYFTNIHVINFPVTLNNLRTKNKVDPNQIVKMKKVYRLKNGMIIDKYRNNYGYWYCVRKGDSLYRIARRSSLKIRTLAKVNNIKINAVLKYKTYLFIPMSENYLKKSAEEIIFNLKKEDFIWPLYGRLTSGFGLRKWGWRKKFHKGIDTAAPPGTKILTSRDGEVTYAGRQKWYGYVIIIKHPNNFETRYAHLQKVLVRRGEKVEQGQVIGLVGKTGRSTGYHLHFEIRINNYAVNPVDYLPKKVNGVVKIYNSKTPSLKP